jgi:hypothetical protein
MVIVGSVVDVGIFLYVCLTNVFTFMLVSVAPTTADRHKDDARLCIWVSDENSGAVSAHEIELYPVVSVIAGEWIVRYDQGLEQKLRHTVYRPYRMKPGALLWA